MSRECVAVCCSVWQGAAVCCSVWHCVAVCCRDSFICHVCCAYMTRLICVRFFSHIYVSRDQFQMEYVAVCCSVLQCVAETHSGCLFSYTYVSFDKFQMAAARIIHRIHRYTSFRIYTSLLTRLF